MTYDTRQRIAIVMLVLIVVTSAVLFGFAINIASDIEESVSETERLGRCLVEQFTEHRIDNRATHESLAKQHGDFRERDTELPDPPRGLPRPDRGVQELLIEACEPYLHQSGLP